MAAYHKGAISFGLVHIPVALHTAVQDKDIHFNQLHGADGARIGYRKTCKHCGKEVGADDIVKGFEYERGKYVVVSEQDFENIKTEKDRKLNILHFTAPENIPPVYYDKTYQAVPEAGGERAYELLRSAMLESNKAAIAKTVMGNNEKLLCIRATQSALLVETLFFADEIKGLPADIPRPQVNAAELEMAKTLIASLDKPFVPDQFRDEYQERLRALITDKIQGKEIIAAKEEHAGNIIDLMDALKASIQQAAPEKKPGGRRKKTG